MYEEDDRKGSEVPGELPIPKGGRAKTQEASLELATVQAVERACKAKLKDEAKRLCSKFWREMAALNGARTDDKWSRISCSVNEKGGRLTIEWHSCRFRKEKAYKIHIPKSRGTKYDINTLKSFCLGFEEELVVEFEHKFRKVREALEKLKGMRASRMALERAVKEVGV